jgi:hypothetical protein
MTYLIAISVFLIPWAAVYWKRADVRTELVWTSMLSISGALPFEYFFWSRDWWHPQTITGTPVGIEDVLYAVGQGGLFAVAYSVVLRRRFAKGAPHVHGLLRLVPFVITSAVPVALILGAKMHSAPATIAGEAIGLAVLLGLRPDLRLVALCSGALGLLGSLGFDVLIELLQPGFIASSWDFEHLSGLWLLFVPAEDATWKLLAGAMLGVAYKFWAGLTPRTVPRV